MKLRDFGFIYSEPALGLIAGVRPAYKTILLTFTYLTAHSPDNTFLGFVVEERRNDTDATDVAKEDIALVYGKRDDFWKVCMSINAFLLSENYIQTEFSG